MLAEWEKWSSFKLWNISTVEEVDCWFFFFFSCVCCPVTQLWAVVRIFPPTHNEVRVLHSALTCRAKMKRWSHNRARQYLLKQGDGLMIFFFLFYPQVALLCGWMFKMIKSLSTGWTAWSVTSVETKGEWNVTCGTICSCCELLKVRCPRSGTAMKHRQKLVRRTAFLSGAASLIRNKWYLDV